MQSNVLSFLLFSILIAIVLYFISPSLKKYVLLFSNLVFYAFCDHIFLLFLCVCILWSYYIGNRLSREISHRNFFLWIGIIPVVLSLGFFKYYNFIVSHSEGFIEIVMPLGISYYMFKIISYLVDFYMYKVTDTGTILEYAVYISFFPQIICGPISRFGSMADKIRNLHRPSYELLLQGFMLILSGLFKKLVIADRLGPYVNVIFSDMYSYPALALWMAAVFYSIQLYCDFAGYSEIVIGIMNIMGFECDANFCFPYFSHSIKDFWHRWHISLSSWLRDYIYIPLGGNRIGRCRTKINMLCAFLISGIWHGNGLNYLFWGIYHGMLNLISYKKAEQCWKRILQIASTFVAVMFGWIFFRSASIGEAFNYIKLMFQDLSISKESIIASVLPFTGDFSCLAYMICVCIFICILFVIEYKEYSNTITVKQKNIHIVVYLGCIIFFGVIGQNSFLYANF